MKWIKASERLPLFSHKLISRFIHTQTPMFDFRDWALNNPDKLHLVEWLDESASLPSSSVTGEEAKDQKWFINQGIEFSKKMKTDSEAYKSGAGFGYSCGLQDGYKSLPVTGESEAIDYKAKYEKCIATIRKFDAGIIGMYDL